MSIIPSIPIPLMRMLLLLVLLILPAIGGAEPLRVFVSVLPQKTFVEKIGGDHVAVRSMVRPDHNPATYDPTPKQIAALAHTDLYLRIGVPFEEAWMARIRAANPDLRVVDIHGGMDLRTMEQHDHSGDGRHLGEGHDTSELDPHVWTSPRYVKQMAAIVRDALTALAPANSGDFERGYRAFAAELDNLDREIRALLKDLPSRKFMVYHPAWGYFADTYSLTQVPVEKEGKEPGARTLTTLINQAKREGLKVIFVQPQFDTKSAAQVAHAIDGQLVVIDPLSADYIDNLRAVARQIAEAAKR